MLQLAALLESGEGCAADPAQALALLRQASALGNASAWAQLGRMYFWGEGVAADAAQALDCYLQAAERGDSAAQFNLGSMYANGQGTAQDYAQALRWYQAAAGQAPAPVAALASVPTLTVQPSAVAPTDLRRAA
jgi:hypothetical protein